MSIKSNRSDGKKSFLSCPFRLAYFDALNEALATIGVDRKTFERTVAFRILTATSAEALIESPRQLPSQQADGLSTAAQKVLEENGHIIWLHFAPQPFPPATADQEKMLRDVKKLLKNKNLQRVFKDMAETRSLFDLMFGVKVEKGDMVQGDPFDLLAANTADGNRVGLHASILEALKEITEKKGLDASLYEAMSQKLDATLQTQKADLYKAQAAIISEHVANSLPLNFIFVPAIADNVQSQSRRKERLTPPRPHGTEDADHQVSWVERARAVAEPKRVKLPAILESAKTNPALIEEIQGLVASLDLRDEWARTLADGLFAPMPVKLLSSVARRHDGETRAMLDSRKSPPSMEGLRQARCSVEQFLAEPSEDPAENLKRQAVKERLGISPLILSALAGDIGLLEAAQDLHDPALKNKFVATRVASRWPGLVSHFAPQPVIVVDEALARPPAEFLPTRSPHLDDRLPPPLILDDTQVAPARFAAPASTQRDPAAAILFETARQEVINAVETFYTAAYLEGYHHFTCHIGKQENGFPIQLRFFNDRNESLDYDVKAHSAAYRASGTPLTLMDAVDLKITAQSLVLNQDGILPRRSVNSGGVVAVQLDDPLPYHATTPGKAKYTIETTGMRELALRINAPDRENGEPLQVSIPLGLAQTAENLLTADEHTWLEKGGPKPILTSETAKRAAMVLSHLDTTAAAQQWLTKRDILSHLRQELELTGGSWIAHQWETLKGFENSTKLASYTSPQGEQSVTMSHVNLCMEPGGENPSWRMQTTFHVSDDPQRAGKAVRSLSLNLHTSSHALAEARARQTLLGAITPKGVTNACGLVEMLQSHAASHPQDCWVKENDHVRIGTKPLTDFFDDMPRYDHDIGVAARVGQQRGQSGVHPHPFARFKRRPGRER